MIKRCAGLVLWCALGCSSTQAEEPSYKFTTGVYALSGGGLSNSHGLDINVRQTSQLGNIWGAWYRSPEQQVSQPRMGWDKSFEASHWRIMPSVQTASGGFWGGSLPVETGDTLFAGVGLGRTNLHPYVNLNFDPNDAWMASVGYRWSSLQSVSVQVVRDNRQNPDQQHLHLLYRTPMPDGQRLTLDVLFKSGLVEDRMVHRTGLSVTYDFAHFFTRIAYDPVINFTPQTMWRFSVGHRY
ncbi:hypothetical protein [Limnohabitans sp. JirII-31]|uniref:hypothetical protein n=1 Tax=Limnohabitans sp. JirII-31 TaxID=1977908 RepID=UPI001E5800EB|nr:hypothetical protein [Limnohabitans sp. JirII-31]